MFEGKLTSLTSVLASVFVAWAIPAFSASAVRSVRNAPPQASMSANVVTDGRTSRMTGTIDVRKVISSGTIRTFSGDFLGDSEGFDWYVSKHFALKTDVGDDAAAECLSLLELAWPQLAAVFGREPPGSNDYRLAMVLAKTKTGIIGAALDDEMHCFSQGGVTQEGFSCCFAFAGTPYQTRYIVLHEAVHLFQYAISGDTRGCYGFFVEGVADFFSSHVYDSESGTLTVNVLDRAPIHNHFLKGITEWREKGKPEFSKIYADPMPSRGLSVVLAAFLQSTPEFETKWHRFCRAVADCRSAASKKMFDRLVGELYGDVRSLDSQFDKWLDGLAPSYRLEGREFDQSGEWFVSAPPASSDLPAALLIHDSLSRRGDFVRDWSVASEVPVMPEGVFSCVDQIWEEQPLPCAFSELSFIGDDGSDILSCVVSNSPVGNLAVFEVNGIRDSKASTRRLPAKLRQGVTVSISDRGGGKVAVALNADSGIVAEIEVELPEGIGAASLAACRRKVRASQPGIRFRPREPKAEAGTCLAANSRRNVGRRFKESGLCQNYDLAIPLVPRVDGVPIRKWRVLGPFAMKKGVYEDGDCLVELRNADESVSYVLDDGGTAIWRDAQVNTIPAIADPILNLCRAFGRQASVHVAYAATSINSEDEGRAELVLGVSDGIRVFVNGKEIHRDFRKREWAAGNVVVPIRLCKGRNEILLRLSHGDGVWLLSGAIRCDFPCGIKSPLQSPD